MSVWIGSLVGADLVLAVTEPTVSGRHDLGRVLQIVRQFRLPFAVCINKADLNPEFGAQIAAEASAAGAAFVATVDDDPAVTHAQLAGIDVIAYGGPPQPRSRNCGEAASVSPRAAASATAENPQEERS